MRKVKIQQSVYKQKKIVCNFQIKIIRNKIIKLICEKYTCLLNAYSKQNFLRRMRFTGNALQLHMIIRQHWNKKNHRIIQC